MRIQPEGVALLRILRTCNQIEESNSGNSPSDQVVDKFETCMFNVTLLFQAPISDIPLWQVFRVCLFKNAPTSLNSFGAECSGFGLQQRGCCVKCLKTDKPRNGHDQAFFYT